MGVQVVPLGAALRLLDCGVWGCRGRLLFVRKGVPGTESTPPTPPPPPQAARAGDPTRVPLEQSVEDLEGDYLWDQEYAWTQLVGGGVGWGAVWGRWGAAAGSASLRSAK